MSSNKRLFIGVYPTGLVYADRQVQVAGDYKRLATLNYQTLILETEPDCPKNLAAQIDKNAEEFINKWEGKQFPISNNQTTLIGAEA